MPSDGVALATLFAILILGGIVIIQAWMLEKRVEEGFARVSEGLEEVKVEGSEEVSGGCRPSRYHADRG